MSLELNPLESFEATLRQETRKLAKFKNVAVISALFTAFIGMGIVFLALRSHSVNSVSFIAPVVVGGSLLLFGPLAIGFTGEYLCKKNTEKHRLLQSQQKALSTSRPPSTPFINK